MIANEVNSILQARLKDIVANSDRSEGEIADHAGCDRGLFNRLKNGRRKFTSASLEVACRLFPEIARCIEAMGTGATPHNTISDGDSGLRARISSAVLDLDIPAEAARLVLRAIRDTR